MTTSLSLTRGGSVIDDLFGFLAPAALALAATLLTLSATPGLAAPQQAIGAHGWLAQSSIVGDCANLKMLNLQGLDDAPTSLLSASQVAATAELPDYCRVTGYVSPQVKFEVRLPTPSAWNSKFYMAGCGGLCGAVDADRQGFTNACNFGLQRNYAVATTDAGHTGASVVDGLWGFDTHQLQVDFGYRSVHVVSVAAKALITTYYGQAPSRSYFAGCSTGGRQGLMEALRYPNDFDGIIAGAPVLDFTGLVGVEGAWRTQANLDGAGAKILDDSKLQLIHDAVYAACDGLDGLVDGLIGDPRACTFDPSSLLCPNAGQIDCLTAAQVDALKKIYTGPRNAAGRQLYPGVPMGSELGWDRFVVGTGPAPSFETLVAEQFLKYLAFEVAPGPSYSASTFNVETDIPKLATAASIYNATSPNLHAFQARGGRLIMYHGWADPGPPPLRTVQYYEDVGHEMGGVETTLQFFRLFMIPGMFHCSGGPLGDEIDFLTPLEQWVEQGKAPEAVIASHSIEGTIDRTRPVYPYPNVAHYRGSGSTDAAASFIGAKP